MIIHGKLGKLAARFNADQLMLSDYAPSSGWGPVPASVDYTQKITAPWGMMKNDTLSDCTCAAIGHNQQVVSASAQATEITPTDAQVISLYSAVSGYSPKKPNSDVGANELDILQYLAAHGFNGYKLLGHCDIDPENYNELLQGMNLFGCLYIGLAMPTAWQGKSVWDVGTGRAYKAGSWGGHAVILPKGNISSLTAVTWGQEVTITQKAMAAYSDEVHCPLWDKWIETSGLSPSNLNLKQLRADMAAVPKG